MFVLSAIVDPTQLNRPKAKKNLDPTRECSVGPNPTHGSTQPMDKSGLSYCIDWLTTIPAWYRYSVQSEFSYIASLLAWHCLHSMRVRVYAAVGRLSVRLSVPAWAPSSNSTGVPRADTGSATLSAYVVAEARVLASRFVNCLLPLPSPSSASIGRFRSRRKWRRQL